MSPVLSPYGQTIINVLQQNQFNMRVYKQHFNFIMQTLQVQTSSVNVATNCLNVNVNLHFKLTFFSSGWFLCPAAFTCSTSASSIRQHVCVEELQIKS